MWRTLDHTADVALEVEAASWAELLAESARAFGEWTSGGTLSPELHETERALEVQGVDRVETWVRYWRELLRLWIVEGFLPVHARVEAASDGRNVRARVGCVSAGALDPAHCADVKAVTWHAARVEEREGRWIGTIVLDL
jgi:SHS2 domain-containing protein